jgi:glucosamine--fructose-6-phosphate aminotransferase (isomerizing)
MLVSAFIRQQPDRLAATLRDAAGILAGWNPGPHDGLMLVGSGSSMNALLATRPPGHDVQVLGPGAFLQALRTGLGTRPLVVVLSQSGHSTTSVAAAEAAMAAGLPTLLITAEAASPIALLPLPRLLLPIGPEPIGPKTKGFTASLGALIALVAHRAGRALPPFDATLLAAVVGGTAAPAAALAATLDAADYLMVTGQGRLFGIALEASLKIAEIAGLPTTAFEPEEALHGRLHGMTSRSLGLLIAGDDAAREEAARIATAMAGRGVGIRILNLTGRATAFDWCEGVAWPAAPFDLAAAIIPFQWLAVALAERRGMAPEAMRYPGLSADLSIKLAPVP